MPESTTIGADKAAGAADETVGKATLADERAIDVGAGTGTNGDLEVMSITEEQAAVRKREKITGGVRVRTTVAEDERIVAEPVVSESVEVERIPLDRWVEAAVPVRQEGDTTVITLVAEEVVVERRLKAVEEIRITKRQTTEHTQARITLRREAAVVEHLDGDDVDDDPA